MAKARKKSIGSQMLERLTEFRDVLATGTDISERFSVRTVEIMGPKAFSKDDVRRLRLQLNMTQAVFAMAIGVSAELVRAWEIDKRKVSPLAGRLLETVEADPQRFVDRVISRVAAKPGKRAM